MKGILLLHVNILLLLPHTHTKLKGRKRIHSLSVPLSQSLSQSAFVPRANYMEEGKKEEDAGDETGAIKQKVSLLQIENPFL